MADNLCSTPNAVQPASRSKWTDIYRSEKKNVDRAL